ncbi:hypothetical protein CRUP_031631, partial [Coryphaenoides rupestris]
MQLEYVDVVFANRPDSNTPMEGEYQPASGPVPALVSVPAHAI